MTPDVSVLPGHATSIRITDATSIPVQMTTTSGVAETLTEFPALWKLCLCHLPKPVVSCPAQCQHLPLTSPSSQGSGCGRLELGSLVRVSAEWSLWGSRTNTVGWLVHDCPLSLSWSLGLGAGGSPCQLPCPTCCVSGVQGNANFAQLAGSGMRGSATTSPLPERTGSRAEKTAAPEGHSWSPSKPTPPW